MKKLLASLALLGLLSCGNEKQAAADETLVKTANAEPEKSKPMASEFADARYAEMGKERLKLFEAGEYDKWGEGLADNTLTYWSGGDSLVGKKAIVDYWKDRREKHIESVQLTNDIWLPIKVNVPQRGPDLPGVWVMSWHQVNVKYKNGKSLQFWVHQDFHYNAQDKIDRTVTYMDRAPINAALETK